jgi:hypothetical protein
MRRLIVLAFFLAVAATASVHLQSVQAVHRVGSVDEDGMRGTREE